jgi:hypothetical protein
MSAIDWATIGVIVAILGMAFVPSAHDIAIALGTGWGVFGFGATVVVMLMRVGETMKARATRRELGDKDFSSLPAEEERLFIPFHQHMLASGAKAASIGGIVGAVLALFGVATAALYTPCSSFCERPPSACKGATNEKQWMDACPSTCERFRTGTDGDKKIEELKACAFSAGTGPICEKVIAEAVTVGLMCPEKQ